MYLFKGGIGLKYPSLLFSVWKSPVYVDKIRYLTGIADLGVVCSALFQSSSAFG